ncbi:hypothetical protein CPC08DRAFT_717826 [Agrocybe pediades]|nr:hypothetical protein CPC08DRAFT_717826 [Agrocybe pediades]
MRDACDPAIKPLGSCVMHHLPNELIYNIFLKNTERHSCYHHLDNRSQVCQLWRSMLLASPVIWGRLLEIDYFQVATDAWRKEILFRSGDALLWVTGRIIPSSLPFLQSILEEKWNKVQLVDLDVFVQVPKETWSFMSKESPSLEWFSVRYYAARGRKIQILPALFNDVAPRLTAFHALKCFNFSMSTSLLSNIRIFTFCAAHTAPMIFSLLKSMPRLTHLRIDGLDGYNNITLVPIEEKDLTMIDLPLLESLQVHGRHCSTLLAFLRHITPSPRCRLLASPFSAAYDAILIWLRAFTNKHPPKYIVLAISYHIPTRKDGGGGEDSIPLNICDSNEPCTVEEAQLGAEIVLDTHGRTFFCCRRATVPSGHTLCFSQLISAISGLSVCY